MRNESNTYSMNVVRVVVGSISCEKCSYSQLKATSCRRDLHLPQSGVVRGLT